MMDAALCKITQKKLKSVAGRMANGRKSEHCVTHDYETVMNWFLFICLIVAVLYPILGEQVDQMGYDFTSKYAELAAPAPANVNVDELVASLRAASNFP
ncbi:hypothetical protein RR46_13267 [Papilio xuthus]|uniref:Uncharacterized protein n=1 Tax=Papilio xuthus TaxID=66420 RepID=A0A194PLA0_PAPXU|nr:hypothetical protein RR46_13267 [Papilio xuthus]